MTYAIFNRTLTKIRLRIYKWIIFVTVNFTKFSKLFKFVILSFYTLDEPSDDYTKSSRNIWSMKNYGNYGQYQKDSKINRKNSKPIV